MRAPAPNLATCTPTTDRESLCVSVWCGVVWCGVPRRADLLSISVFLVVIRFVRELRIIPGWGPMLIAVVKTWHDATVVLYVGVMICFILACAFSFEIAFGIESGNFSSISRSFMSLFRMVRARFDEGCFPGH
jgi:hypothetical protein